jgi:O-antigen ligase
MLLFSIQRLNRKNALFFLASGIIFLTVFINFSDKSARIYEGISESQNYLQLGKGGNDTSIGLRLSFWKNSLEIISETPWFGHGTGSYPVEYQRVIEKTEALAANPHNEYLMITVQLGILGLLLFLAFLYSQYHYSIKLKNQDKWMAQGVLLSLMVNSLFNSSFIDFTEGYWFTVMISLCFSSCFNNQTH